MKKRLLFIILVLIYLLVPILIFFNSKLFEFKFYILTILGVFIFILLKLFSIKNSDLGFNKYILSSIKVNLPLICVFVLLIIIFKLVGLNRYNPTEGIYFYLFYVFISCPIQEFLYRGVFGYFEKYLISNKYLITIISSFLYSFVHIIYKDFLTCILTFIIGIIWYILYRRNYNLFGVVVSHIILGILTISLGIVN